MAGWFSRMSRGGERADSEPVEFSVSCGCGNMMTGNRTRRMQVVVCRKCAMQICVLPASPYPRPKLRVSKKKPVKPVLKPLRELGPDDVEVIESAPVSKRDHSKSGKKSPSKSADKTPKPGSATSFKPKFKGTDKSKESELDEFVPTVPRTKLITPLRLISLGMVCLIFLGGWWTLHRRAVHQAGLTFAETAKSGRAALAKSDYESADQQFRKAVNALDLLGREDREARQVRQLARESTVANGLATTSLFELISESRQAKVMSGDGWQQLLKRSNQGSWFLFDTNGLQFDEAASTPGKFSVLLIPGEDPISIRGDLSRWSKVLGDKPPTRLVFAGQLEDITPIANGGNGWQMVLNPETLVLWTNVDQYSALGGYLDEFTVQTLKSQAQLLGIVE